MANDGEVVFSVDLETKRAKSSLKDMTAAIDKESKKWDDSVKESADKMGTSFASALKGIGVAISAAAIGKKLLDIGKDALQAASDLEEVQNVVDVTFGESASTIDKWAKQAGSSFGLTETQAKKFASTLGAMMKSAGMSGKEIVNMSTDLAGLAADMASFYNLDFETAFQKIRSGISGETEPLKQLGVNMSVANLEAFALTQGITKAFDKMTQGEQTMLRYQYMMQATADAQGDFARTSDGYANSLRLMQTEIETLKTKLGEVLIPVIKDVVQEINGMIEMLTPKQGSKTVLDEFAEIDLDTASKIAEIERTAKEANALSETLKKITTWNAFGGKTTLKNAFDNLPDADKVKAWNDLFSVVATNADAIISASENGEGTSTWLQGIANSANELDPSNAEAWGTLLESLSGGLSELSKTDEGRKVLESLTEQYLAMGTNSVAGMTGLMALGYSSEEIADKQSKWLETCKRLVQTIPELSSVIDVETGAVEGGIDAVKDYVDAWERGQKYIALTKAQERRRDALANKYQELPGLEVDWMVAENRIKQQKQKLDELRKKYGIDGEGYDLIHRMNLTGGAAILTKEEQEWNQAIVELGQLQHAALEARKEYEKQSEAYNEAMTVLEEGDAAIKEAYGDLEQMAKGAEDSAKAIELTTDEMTALTNAMQGVADAYSELSDYIEKVHQETASSIANTIHGFENVLTPADKARASMKDLTKQMDELRASGGDVSSIEKTFQAVEGSIPSVQNMTNALISQLAFIDRYQTALDNARANGVSDAVLASLADGSPESLDYLEALAEGGNIEELNAKFAEVEAKQAELTNSLTSTKLKVDETYDDLVAKAKEAAMNLDQSATAADATALTVNAIITTLQEKKVGVDEQVDAINASLARLGSATSGLSFGTGLFGFLTSTFKVNGSHATGLDYVPFDNYIAQLHEGESILTAEEANIWRQFKYGQMSSRNVDYDALGATMRDNVKTGGNVYLDGQTVGRVISASQANDYRRLERSGWQS